MNKLLECQIRRTLESGEKLSPEMEKLLQMVSDSYDHHEQERVLFEHARENRSEKEDDNEKELKELEARKQANLRLQQFVSIASHDLKAPLRTVRAFTQLLERKILKHLDDSGKEYLTFIQGGVERMNTLIEDLTCFSRIGIQNEAPQLIDTNQILERVKYNLQAQFSETNGELIIEGPLPHISALDFQLIHLFQNLISNALKFKGEQAPRICISWTEQAENCCVQIKDNGIGIAEEHIGKVFEVFQRLHNSSDFDGSGLGLSICKKVMENLGGDIRLESAVGEGTTFFLMIPKAKVMMPELV